MYTLYIVLLFSFLHFSAGQGCQADIKLNSQQGTWERDGINNKIYMLDVTNTGECSFTGIIIHLSVPDGSTITTSWGMGGSNSLINNFGTIANGQTFRGPGFVLSGDGEPSITINNFEGCGCTAPGGDTGAIAPSDPGEPTTTSTTTGEPVDPPSTTSGGDSVPDGSFYTVGLKFLLLACNDTDVRAAVARTTFMSVGTPYEEIIFSSQGSSSLNLKNSDGSGKYMAIISATDFSLCWSQGQVTEVEEYEKEFHTKTVIMYTYPYITSGMEASSVGGIPLSGARATFASDFLPSIPFLNHSAEFDVSGVYAYPAIIITPSIATPALYGFLGNEEYIFGAFIKYEDGRCRLEFYVDQGTFALYAAVVGDAWLQWASNGLFAGLRRVEFNAHVDDVFMATGAFDASTGAESTTVIFRTSPEDLQNINDWQTLVNERLPAGSEFVLTFPFNMDTVNQKGGTSVDELYLTAKTLRDNFFWESHTFTHPYLDNMTYQQVRDEFEKNTAGAMELFDNNLNNTKYSTQSVVTPSISGLYNGEALRAMWDIGIRYVVGDNSRSDLVPTNLYHGLYTNKSYNGFDGIYIIPRHATNIYYFASTVPEIEEQYNLRYEATLGYKNFTSIVDMDVNVATKSLLTYRHDPFMFHQANMRTITIDNVSISLLGHWVDKVLDSIFEYTTLPVVSHTHDKLAQMYLEREERDRCGFVGQLKVNSSSHQYVGLTARSDYTCKFPVSGAVASDSDRVVNELYGSERTMWLDLAPNSPVQISFLEPVSPL